MIPHNRSTKRLPLLTLLLLATVSAGMVAQDDIRLSVDPLQVMIPDDAAIQSAGQIGSVRLVVWGSTRGDAGGVVNVLYMQRLRDTVQLGQPRIVTSSDARPYGFVQVVSLADRFLVCWNDRRGEAAMLAVDTAGDVGAESFLGKGPLVGNIFAVPTAGGYMLMWNHRDDSIHACRIDREGKLLEREFTYGSGYLGAFHDPVLLPGSTILDRGDRPPIVMDRDGRNIPLGVPASELAHAYYLGNDGDVVTIHNDTVREYRTILDSVPSRTFRVALEAGAISQTETVSRDTAGRIQITYMVNGTPYSWFASTELFAPIRRVVEQAPGEFGKPFGISMVLVLYTAAGCYQFSIHDAGATLVRGCDNSYLVRTRFAGSYHGLCHGGDTPGNLNAIFPYLITSEGYLGRLECRRPRPRARFQWGDRVETR